MIFSNFNNNVISVAALNFIDTSTQCVWTKRLNFNLCECI